MTRFLKMSGVTPCRVGRLIRSVAILAVFSAPAQLQQQPSVAASMNAATITCHLMAQLRRAILKNLLLLSLRRTLAVTN